MKSRILQFLVFVAIVSIQTSFAQDAVVRGKVVDGDFNDVLAFANIVVKGTTTGTTSDFEGNYELTLAPGSYTLSFSFVGYQTKEITDVNLSPGQEITVDVTLNSSGVLDEILITTTLSKNSESAVLSFQKNSVALLDGLSLESIKATGASNIASAVKSVPGVSVQGGKYVYVRGLGDRYTKSTLNGMDIPGLDPDRNTIQLDLFPTKILENILVVKSATADQPADFTGGVVDIVTKDIPGKAEYSLSLGLGYNSDFHFKSDYITQPNSGTDMFGFDDGLRSNPIAAAQQIPLPQQNGEVVSTLTRLFEKDLAAQRDQSLMDMNLSVTAGNQFTVGDDNKLGFFASVSYRNETKYYDEYVNGQIFRKDEADKSNFNLLLDRGQSGQLGNNNVLISGLLGTTFKTERSKYSLNLLHIQNGETENSIFRQVNGIISSNQVKKDNLTYVQRAVSNALLSGKHSFLEDGRLEVEWKLSPSYATIYDKDFRVTPFRVLTDPETGEESFVIEPSESGDAGRFWRDLEEYNLPGKIDVTLDHKLFGREAETKIGGAYTFKNRVFDVTRFSFPFLNFQSVNLGGNPDNLLLDPNIYDSSTNSGVFVRKDSSDSDKFDSDTSVMAGYFSESFKVQDWMRIILGVRFEKFDLVYTGERQDGSRFDDTKILDKSDFFPSANLIFDLDSETTAKIRTSYSRTTARPSFKEASLAEIFDPISSNTFIGNLELQPTYIDNIDVRFEKYGEGGDFFAISGFYKSFDDPIELSFIRRAYGQYTPLNLGDAEVFGGELELRKRLDFIPGMEDVRLITNISIIESQQNYSDDEREGRLDNLREGETLDDTRQLQGQSPYLINAGFSYDSEENGWQGGLFYNVQGKTLQIVGAGDVADVYTLPFHNVKFNLSKTFGESKNSTLSLSFDNILDDDVESVYQSFGAEDQLFSKWNPGQSISLGYSLNF